MNQTVIVSVTVELSSGMNSVVVYQRVSRIEVTIEVVLYSFLNRKCEITDLSRVLD